MCDKYSVINITHKKTTNSDHTNYHQLKVELFYEFFHQHLKHFLKNQDGLSKKLFNILNCASFIIFKSKAFLNKLVST